MIQDYQRSAARRGTTPTAAPKRGAKWGAGAFKRVDYVRSSASQVELARRCWRKWGFKYLFGLPDPSGPAADFGKEVHKLLEHHLGPAAKALPDTKAGKVAAALLPLLPPRGSVPAADLEAEIKIAAGPLNLLGYIDLVERKRGAVRVTDFKTRSSRKWAPGAVELQHHPQAVIYSRALLERYPGLPSVTFRHANVLTDGTGDRWPVSVRISRADNDTAFAEVVATCEQQAAYSREVRNPADLPANYDACSDYGACPYLAKCRRLDGGVFAMVRTASGTKNQDSGGGDSLAARRRERLAARRGGGGGSTTTRAPARTAKQDLILAIGRIAPDRDPEVLETMTEPALESMLERLKRPSSKASTKPSDTNPPEAPARGHVGDLDDNKVPKRAKADKPPKAPRAPRIPGTKQLISNANKASLLEGIAAHDDGEGDPSTMVEWGGDYKPLEEHTVNSLREIMAALMAGETPFAAPPKSTPKSTPKADVVPFILGEGTTDGLLEVRAARRRLEAQALDLDPADLDTWRELADTFNEVALELQAGVFARVDVVDGEVAQVTYRAGKPPKEAASVEDLDEEDGEDLEGGEDLTVELLTMAAREFYGRRSRATIEEEEDPIPFALTLGDGEDYRGELPPGSEVCRLEDEDGEIWIPDPIAILQAALRHERHAGERTRLQLEAAGESLRASAGETVEVREDEPLVLVGCSGIPGAVNVDTWIPKVKGASPYLYATPNGGALLGKAVAEGLAGGSLDLPPVLYIPPGHPGTSAILTGIAAAGVPHTVVRAEVS